MLCIDNQESILDGMRALLANWSCGVRTATGLADMEALLARDPRAPDLIIADYHLGVGADGIACVEAVRRRFGADLPAILITADRSDELKARAAASGLPVLSKPIRPAALRALMRRGLAARQAAE